MNKEPIDGEEVWKVSTTMIKYGDSFVQHLGEALRHADSENKRKIYNTWPEY